MKEQQPLDRRRFLAGAAVAAAAVAAGPTAGQALASPRSFRRGGASKPPRLNILYATAEANSDAVKLAIPAFQKDVGISIGFDTIPYNGLQQKVFSELASGSSHYDIMLIDVPWYPALASKLEPLGPLLSNSSLQDVSKPALNDFIGKVFYDTVVYNPKNLQAHIPEGETKSVDLAAIDQRGFEVLGLPIQANAMTMGYRKDLFDKAHKKVPTTWDEFLKAAQFFTDPSKRLWGTTLMAGTGEWASLDWTAFFQSWGGNGHWVTDNDKVVLNTPTGVKALQFYSDLINKYKVTPPGTTSASWDTVATTFDNGLTAMTFNYHTLGLSPNIKNGEIMYALVPSGTAHVPRFGTWSFAINKYGKNKEWAYRAMSWFTSAHAQELMLAKQLHPTRVSVYKAASKSSTITRSFGNYYDILGKSLALGVGRPRLKNYPDVSNAIAVAVNEAATARLSPAAALTKAQSRVTKLLKQAGYKVQA